MSAIPDEAVQAAADAIHTAGWTCEAHEPQGLDQCEGCASATPILARKALTAAAPHLRAAWEEPIRELCEAQIERANGPLSSRGFNGQPFPAMVSALDILDLLEGGDDE